MVTRARTHVNTDNCTTREAPFMALQYHGEPACCELRTLLVLFNKMPNQPSRNA